MEYITVSTEIVNRWWDLLPHNMKEYYIKKMNTSNWGSVPSVSAISKYQKNELYQQVFKINNKQLNN